MLLVCPHDGTRNRVRDKHAAPQAMARLGIRSIPTTLLFVQVREVARQSGAMSAAQLHAWVDHALR